MPAHRRQDVGLDLLLVALARPLPLARQVLVLEAFAEIGDGGCRPLALMLADRVGPAIDQPLEPLGLIPRGARGPVREAANGPAPLAAVALAPVVQNEGADCRLA